MYVISYCKTIVLFYSVISKGRKSKAHFKHLVMNLTVASVSHTVDYAGAAMHVLTSKISIWSVDLLVTAKRTQ